jgi:hypothetical protein
VFQAVARLPRLCNTGGPVERTELSPVAFAPPMPARRRRPLEARIETESPDVIMLREAQRTSGDEWRRRELNPPNVPAK